MARRKRSRGLGGTPEQHEKRVQTNLDAAASYFTTAMRAADQLRCKLAFTSLIGGVSQFAVAKENAHDAGRSVPVFPAHEKDSYNLAVERVKQMCLVGGGLKGLSGARRRRSRR